MSWQAMVRRGSRRVPQAIVGLCADLAGGAPLVPALETELGLPIIDSISAVV